MTYSIDTGQEDGGRWIAEVPERPGVMAYGTTREDDRVRAQVLAPRAIAERIEQGEARRIDIRISLLLHESSAFVEGLAGTRRATANWLAPRAPVRLSSNLCAGGLARLRICIQRSLGGELNQK